MSYFRKSILLFVFMFGVFSAPYASADLCKSIQEHLTAVVATCKGKSGGGTEWQPGYSFGYAEGGSCEIATTNSKKYAICAVVNPGITHTNGVTLSLINLTSVGKYCPDGANGSPCECKKGTNWQTKTQKCVQSR